MATVTNMIGARTTSPPITLAPNCRHRSFMPSYIACTPSTGSLPVSPNVTTP